MSESSSKGPFPDSGRVSQWPITIDATMAASDIGAPPDVAVADGSEQLGKLSSAMACVEACAARAPYCKYAAITEQNECSLWSHQAFTSDPADPSKPPSSGTLLQIYATDDDTLAPYAVFRGVPDTKNVIVPSDCPRPIDGVYNTASYCELQFVAPPFPNNRIVSPSGRILPGQAYDAMKSVCDTDDACAGFVVDDQNNWGTTFMKQDFADYANSGTQIASATEVQRRFLTWVKAATADHSEKTANTVVNGKAVPLGAAQFAAKTSASISKRVLLIGIAAFIVFCVVLAVIFGTAKKQKQKGRRFTRPR